MMDFPGYGKKGGGAQAWQAQVAQQPTPLMTTQPVGGYEPVDFQGMTTTTEPDQEGYDWAPEDLMTWEFPQGGFGVGGGEAVNFGEFDVESMKALFPQLATEDLSKQLMEQAGLGGTRWSSVLGQKIADATARAKESWALDMFGKWIASQEAAKQRGLQAGMASAEGAMFEAGLPMRVAGMMAGLAGQAQEAEMQPWSVAYQDWLRTTPEGAMGTYGRGVLDLLGQEPGGPTQHEEGWASKIAGMGGGLLPVLMGGMFDKGSTTALPPGRDFGNLPFVMPRDLPWGGE